MAGKFLFKILILIALVTAVLAPLEMVARKIYRNEEPEFDAMIDSLKKRSGNVNTVILGSSHSRRGIRDDLLSEEIFNMAFYSQDLYYNIELIKRFIPELPELRRIVLEVDPFTMCYDQIEVSRYTARRYARLGIPARQRFNTMLFLQSNFELLNHREKFIFDLFRFIVKGEYPHPMTHKPVRDLSGEKAVRRTLKERLALHNGFYGSGKTFRKNLEFLARFYSFTETAGIKVTVLHMPVTDLYWAGLSQELKDAFAETEDLIIGKCPLWSIADFRFLYAGEYSLFRDADHLNEEGSRKFTALLNEYLGRFK